MRIALESTLSQSVWLITTRVALDRAVRAHVSGGQHGAGDLALHGGEVRMMVDVEDAPHAKAACLLRCSLRSANPEITGVQGAAIGALGLDLLASQVTAQRKDRRRMQLGGAMVALDGLEQLGSAAVAPKPRAILLADLAEAPLIEIVVQVRELHRARHVVPRRSAHETEVAVVAMLLIRTLGDRRDRLDDSGAEPELGELLRSHRRVLHDIVQHRGDLRFGIVVAHSLEDA